MLPLIWNLSARDSVKACEILAGVSKDIGFQDKRVPSVSFLGNLFPQLSKPDANASKNEGLSGSVMRLLMVIICWQPDFLQVVHFISLSAT